MRIYNKQNVCMTPCTMYIISKQYEFHIILFTTECIPKEMDKTNKDASYKLIILFLW